MHLEGESVSLTYFFLPEAEADETAGFFWLLAFFALC
jgi:hypothetical protein